MKRFCAVAAVCAGMMFSGSAAFAQTSEALPVLSTARVYTMDAIPPRTMANGGQSWDVLKGVLPTGEKITLHESVQPVGAKPNPAHSINHSEVITVIEGTVAFEHDGKSEVVGPGGVIFVALGTMHAVRNVGTVPAKYAVLMIGGDAK
jgi:mannose-6-phosphate isomerase-like protein (cupin superfamily)